MADIAILRTSVVFTACFLLVTMMNYVPFISCLTAGIGKLVVVAAIFGVIRLVFAKNIDSCFGQERSKVNPKGKAVFITGCDTGFGYDLALRLHKFGFHVYAGCLSPIAAGGQALQSAGKTDGRLEVFPLDVTKIDQVNECASSIKKDLQSRGLELFAVVNNAGVTVYCEFEWIPMKEFEKMMDVNAVGSVRVMKAFIPMLRESAGRIVIVASLSGRYSVPGMVGYSMTKHAQIALADGLRRELRKFRISVSLIEPGAYRTAMADFDILLTSSNAHWQNSAEDVRSFYGEPYYAAFQKHLERISALSNPNVSEPVDCMEDAIISLNPKYRYAPGSIAAQIRGAVMMFLPYTVQDYLMKHAGTQALPAGRQP